MIDIILTDPNCTVLIAIAYMFAVGYVASVCLAYAYCRRAVIKRHRLSRSFVIRVPVLIACFIFAGVSMIFYPIVLANLIKNNFKLLLKLLE